MIAAVFAPMTTLHLTYCSAKKRDELKNSREKVAPDALYTSARIQKFVAKCREEGVPWAIFSDKFGVWLADERHEWYEKPPDSVTEAEFSALISDAARKLSPFSEVIFHVDEQTFHPLYRKLVEKLRERGVKIRVVSCTSEPIS
jgi:hypothetical protein